MQVDMPIGKAGVLKFIEREFKPLHLQIWQVRFSTPKLNRTCHLCCRYSYLVNIISNKVINSLLQHNYIGNSLKKYSLYESGKDFTFLLSLNYKKHMTKLRLIGYVYHLYIKVLHGQDERIVL